MCGSKPAINLTEPEDLPDAPSAREKTATEILRPASQVARQTLAGKLGVQLLKSPLLNAPK